MESLNFTPETLGRKCIRTERRHYKLIASQIPWDVFEDEYSSHFGVSGNDAYPVRMALGSLIIKERLKSTDEEMVRR
jgi:hypothetical protein